MNLIRSCSRGFLYIQEKNVVLSFHAFIREREKSGHWPLPKKTPLNLFMLVGRIFAHFPVMYKKRTSTFLYWFVGAVDEIRTRDIHLGKVALYH